MEKEKQVLSKSYPSEKYENREKAFPTSESMAISSWIPPEFSPPPTLTCSFLTNSQSLSLSAIELRNFRF